MSVLETPVAVGGVVLRQLPTEEWERLAAASGPLHGLPLPPSDQARVIVAEADGRIVAYWVIAAMVHLDPLYIEPGYRHRPQLIQALIGLATLTLQEVGVTHAFAIVADGDQPANGILLEKLGFTPIPGTLYSGAIPPGD